MCGTSASAGGGPENVLLVVNKRSVASKTIANHWIRLRQIPPSNVLYLDWKHGVHHINAEVFRDDVIAPIVTAITKRKLGSQIDYVVYSADLPWKVDLRKELGDKYGKAATPVASLTGATYLWRFVQAKSPAILSLNSNFYAVAPQENEPEAATGRAFRSRYQWSKNGRKVDSEGQQYLLSTMLAVKAGRGINTEEAIRYLTRAAQADGTHPGGTIYLMRNNNVRSRVRHDDYGEAAARLQKTGIRVQVEQGILPQRRTDVQGLTLGAADFDWEESGSKILPGAICEHLTSYGGVMLKDWYQTPLVEFLRHGAAGASGTVIEPLALAQKFPRPEIHALYAQGCSLAEAYYQSVSGPFQLLIMGDPLCQPWARFPQVSLHGVEPGETVSGEIEVHCDVQMPEGHRLDHLELYVGGRLARTTSEQDSFKIDTSKLSDGWHEIRVVAVDNHPLEFQGRAILPVWVNNHAGILELERQGAGAISLGEDLTLTLRSPQAASMALLQNNRIVGRVEGESGQIKLRADALGWGPVRLWAISLGEHPTVSQPLWLNISR